MNLRTITLFAVALTLYLVGSTALNLISSLLPIPIPVECILIGLFMGMFPRRTATVFYAVTCGLLIIETIVNIPNLIINLQTVINLALVINKTQPITPLITNDYSMVLNIIIIISTILVLVKYRIKVIKLFFEVMLSVVFILIYIWVPLIVLSFIVFGLSNVSINNVINSNPILLAYIFVFYDIYLTVTGPLVARWIFRRIGIYRRIPKIWQG